MQALTEIYQNNLSQLEPYPVLDYAVLTKRLANLMLADVNTKPYYGVILANKIKRLVGIQ
eukprot:13859805-Ditylum_brightwellii.AAC.1